MAIDGQIISTEKVENGVQIEIASRPANCYITERGDLVYSPQSTAGQSKMIIKNATFEPKIGDTIWGGSNSVFINSGGMDFPYKRELYTTLIQNW